MKGSALAVEPVAIPILGPAAYGGTLPVPYPSLAANPRHVAVGGTLDAGTAGLGGTAARIGPAKIA